MHITARHRSPTMELGVLARFAGGVEGVDKAQLCAGDRVLVATRNSVYSICVLEDGRYAVTGGWFSRQGLSPFTVAINGCTFGGRAIHTGLLAARGLFLEFGNRVITSRIQHVCVIPREALVN